MIAAMAEKSVNQMSRVIANIHGAFYVNLADNKQKLKLRPSAKSENIGSDT